MNRPTLKGLLSELVVKGGSDLHLSANSPPRMRISGTLLPIELPALTAEDAETLCFEVISEEQRNRFQQCRELDFSFGLEGISRFRGNLYLEKESVAGAFRALPWKIPDFAALGLPPAIHEIVKRRYGLVLVTGATGSGKSTTIASILDQINHQRHDHIITVEDPIEYVFEHGTCMVHQREVGTHTENFKSALKHVLRQDPDIVLIGEMRDLETIQTAITVAETGHLVFATLHTNTAVQTIDRIIDVFPPSQQPQVRSQLAFILAAVFSQQLVPIKNGGRRLALEMLLPTSAIRNLIREGKTHQIYGQMQSGQGRTGMRTMNQALLELHRAGSISEETVQEFSPDWEEFLQIQKRPMQLSKASS